MLTGPRGQREVRLQPHAPVAAPASWPDTQEGPAGAPAAPGIPHAIAATGHDHRHASGTRILVAGVGYGNLRDLSVGPVLVERLRRREWPVGVYVEDLSFGAVHVLHWFQESPPFDAAVFLAAVARGRKPGSIHRYTWMAPYLAAEEVQTRVAEAVTGIISLDTLLTVVGYFGALPPRVHVIEVEPRDQEWGAVFSPLVEAALDRVEGMIQRHVRELLA